MLLISILIAFCLGSIFARPSTLTSHQNFSKGERELREKKGRFISPLLECEVFDDQEIKVLKPFKYKVEDLLQKKISAGILTDGSVYFRDLNNGMWFGIDEDKRFRPASMLKVRVMIAYFKLAENNPALLEKRVTFKGDYDYTTKQGIRPSRELVPGMSYTVDELIYRMIVYSDNNASRTLIEHIDETLLNKVLVDLDVNVNPDDPEHLLTAHSYAGFFRILYNSTYLSRKYSEKALELLSLSKFTEGIRAGLPPGLQAATKFGEWGTGPDPDIVQLHEFGIVYHPQRPYLIGIMTRGKRGNDLTSVIRDISRIIYESVDSPKEEERD